MIVDMYCFCWNEAAMLGFMFKHYDPYVRRYVVYDTGSTDGSVDLLRDHPRVELRKPPPFDPLVARSAVGLAILETCWRQTSMEADWVIITDVDEHLYHPKFADYLEHCRAAGITIIPALGYQMLSAAFPPQGQRLSKSVTSGAPWVQMNKLGLFNPKAVDRLNFMPGRHVASPTGRIIAPDQDELLLLHYKYLDFERVMQRHQELSTRLNEMDVANGFGHRWRFSREQLQEDWLSFEKRVVDISRDDLEPWSSHPPPRWWDRYRLASRGRD